jgi:hypothetical protein
VVALYFITLGLLTLTTGVFGFAPPRLVLSFSFIVASYTISVYRLSLLGGSLDINRFIDIPGIARIVVGSFGVLGSSGTATTLGLSSITLLLSLVVLSPS